jgi:hypothetical protein
MIDGDVITIHLEDGHGAEGETDSSTTEDSPLDTELGLAGTITEDTGDTTASSTDDARGRRGDTGSGGGDTTDGAGGAGRDTRGGARHGGSVEAGGSGWSANGGGKSSGSGGSTASLLLELNSGLLLFGGTVAGYVSMSSIVTRVINNPWTYLVRQATAAFWKAAEVQTQVVSVLNRQYDEHDICVEKTHMDEHPAVAAASVTQVRTQAVIPLAR